MMKSWKPHVCGAAYAVVAIIPTFLLTVGPAAATTVTASASGTFDDAAGWTAVATWDDSVMADNVVSISEMLTFTVTTAVGPILGGGFYDLTDVIFTGGFTFDGPSASANIIGGIGGYYIYFSDVATFAILDMTEDRLREFNIVDNSSRVAMNWGEDGTSVWNVSVVPEPSSVMLLALGAIGLVGSRGRRRRRHARS